MRGGLFQGVEVGVEDTQPDTFVHGSFPRRKLRRRNKRASMLGRTVMVIERRLETAKENRVVNGIEHQDRKVRSGWK